VHIEIYSKLLIIFCTVARARRGRRSNLSILRHSSLLVRPIVRLRWSVRWTRRTNFRLSTPPPLLLQSIHLSIWTALQWNARIPDGRQVSAAADSPARRSDSCPPCCIQMSTVSVINWWPRPSPVYHTNRPPKLTAPETSAVPEIWLVPIKI